MLIRIDPSLPDPIFVQIASQVRGALARNDVAVGETLPAVRDLADSLGVNMHTVRAAYGVLRDEGLIEMRRGRSVTVIAEGPARASLVELARELVRCARLVGLGNPEIRELLEVQL